ncbi:hypothetical protein [Companilactobacillus versmoldensis]|uniref:Uncharacterized protein n=1 Tax=Companilactobacillus versmoldensis DSM 14857 = KCTC 3814 TaxID=1423815 RepID=A0A0R1SN76_9LACO|nr:hypothetical protein [Companilactobacillus versmoldensis]KRL68154.1 hypothetical protein FC27_GL000895 [Companilactobacillus versmoldensis DSM 14857 = KCTC 3814]
MGILYKVKRSSIIGLILIAAISLFAEVYCKFVLMDQFSQTNKALVVLLAIIAMVVVLAIVYAIYLLILKKESVEYRSILLVNVAVTFAIGGVLQTIVMLSTQANTNILANILIGVIQFGLLAWINWTSLAVSRQAKINISIWTLIMFIISLF